MAFDWQTVHFPLGVGLATGQDPRAQNPPELAVARDVQFVDIGGLETRKPFAALGSAVTDGRRLVTYGDELLLFTKDKLKSWSASDAEWVDRADYLAPTLSERPVFVRTGEQTQVDRLLIDGKVIYAWIEDDLLTQMFVAVADAATGAVVMPPTAVSTVVVPSRPRLVIAGSSALLFWTNGGDADLVVIALDPDDVSAGLQITPTNVVTADHNLYYDVVSNGTIAYVVNRRQTTTAYNVHRVTSALVVTSVTKARTCDGPIAVSLSPTGTVLQIVRANGTDIQGDAVLSSTLADVYTAQAIGTASGTVNQIAAAHRSVTDSGAYRCQVFWSSGESPSSVSFLCKHNWVDTSNNLGAQATFLRTMGVASRAFDHDGSVFVWLVFAQESTSAGMGEPLGFRAQLQNSYFLYRDDGLLVGKSTMAKAGGFAAEIGHLPGVQNTATDEYTWSGIERRIIPLGGDHTGYAARSPRDIALTFDDNDARRCVHVGATLYVAGAQILQYDGEGLTEVGFHVYPWFFAAVDGGAAAGDGKDAGQFALKSTWAWQNAKGDLDVSTTATAELLTVTGGNKIAVSPVALHVTMKQDDRADVSVRIWATLKDPGDGAPFHLVTGNDPSDQSGPNCYIQNAPNSSLSTFHDELLDEDAAKLEINPENGDVLESLSPPAATIIAADQDRVFLAGVAGEPHRVWYSKTRTDGEVASFHDALTIDVPQAGGPITALEFLDETLIVFKETAVYALPGIGFDNTSGGQNYGPARQLSSDCGAVSAEGVAATPAGLVFKSLKGWYMLTGSGSVEYIGERVADFDADEVQAVHSLPAQHQIRFVTDERILVFDHRPNARQWFEWTEADCVGATIWYGTYHVATATAVKAEQATHTALTYGLDVETAWIKVADLQGQGAVAQMMALGEFRSAHDLRVRVAYNYKVASDGVPLWVDSKFWSATPTTVGGPLQVKHGPSIHRCQSIKFRLTAYATDSEVNPPTGEALRLTGLALKLGTERGLYKGLPAAQKQ